MSQRSVVCLQTTRRRCWKTGPANITLQTD